MNYYRTGLADALRSLDDRVLVGAYKPSADPLIRRVAQAVRAVAPEFGFPSQPTDRYVTAHAILSTGWFDDDLSRLHNGVFGMKASGAPGRYWAGAVALMPTGEWYTPEEIARAQAIPAGQRGSFIRYLDAAPDHRGKRKVLIWDGFRKYATAEEAIRDHFRLLTEGKRSDGSLRYARSAAKLRAAAPDYMKQLGLDGWYTGDSERMQADWSNIANGRRLRDILAAGGGGGVAVGPDPDPARPASGASAGGVWVALGAGAAAATALVLATRK